MVVDPLSINYNLTALAATNVVSSPAEWLHVFDGLLGNIIIISLLAVTGIVLFAAMRSNVESDSEALSYAGLITSVLGVFLFVLKTEVTGSRLIEFLWLTPILLITAVSLFINTMRRRF